MLGGDIAAVVKVRKEMKGEESLVETEGMPRMARSDSQGSWETW